MSNRAWQVAVLLTFVALLVGCAETPQVTRTPVRIRLADATDHAVVIDKLMNAYSHDREWVAFATDALPGAEAIDRVRNDHLDLAILPSSPEQAGAHMWQSGFAYDSIAVIVHPGNPTGDLSLMQLRDIFQGRTFDWTPFGGAGDVIPVSREESSVARQLFEERVMNGRAVTLNAVLKSSNQEVLDYVADTPGAIGYLTLSRVDERVKIVSVEGVPPTPANAASGKYALSFPIYLLARTEPLGDIREFVAWLLSDEGQALLSQNGLGRVR
jgi:phosphate transport system substrate-binding protein